jgi:hypothetical protein
MLRRAVKPSAAQISAFTSNRRVLSFWKPRIPFSGGGGKASPQNLTGGDYALADAFAKRLEQLTGSQPKSVVASQDFYGVFQQVSEGVIQDVKRVLAVTGENRVSLTSVLAQFVVKGLGVILVAVAFGVLLENYSGGPQASKETREKNIGGKMEKSKNNFNDVKGCPEAVEEMKQVVDFLKHPERFHEIGAKLQRGILMVGPPGTGKTVSSNVKKLVFANLLCSFLLVQLLVKLVCHSFTILDLSLRKSLWELELEESEMLLRMLRKTAHASSSLMRSMLWVDPESRKNTNLSE